MLGVSLLVCAAFLALGVVSACGGPKQPHTETATHLPVPTVVAGSSLSGRLDVLQPGLKLFYRMEGPSSGPGVIYAVENYAPTTTSTGSKRFEVIPRVFTMIIQEREIAYSIGYVTEYQGWMAVVMEENRKARRTWSEPRRLYPLKPVLGLSWEESTENERRIYYRVEAMEEVETAGRVFRAARVAVQYLDAVSWVWQDVDSGIIVKRVSDESVASPVREILVRVSVVEPAGRDPTVRLTPPEDPRQRR